MYTTIHRWGNSQAVRLPKGILEIASLRENDQVEITAEHDCIIIRRAKKKHLTIEERFEGYINVKNWIAANRLEMRSGNAVYTGTGRYNHSGF